MYETEIITVQELVNRMRKMEVGAEIGLAATEDGEYSYGIRRLPDAMFDNGMCWIADYYGGGSTKAFSETEDDFREFPSYLVDDVEDWLVEQGVMIDPACDPESGLDDDATCVYVQIKDGSLPETVWRFTEEKKEPQQNAVACIDFGLVRTYRMYLSVPKDATMDAIAKLGRRVLCTMTPEEFGSKVLDTSTGGEPFIADEDIDWMGVNQSDRGWNIDHTTEPVGTVIG